MSAPVRHRDPVQDPGVPKPLPCSRVTVAHVLYMDLVAYSQSNTERQAALVSELLEVVRGVPEFQAARNANRVISLDSGDGLALVFLVNLIGAPTGVGWLGAMIMAFGPRRLSPPPPPTAPWTPSAYRAAYWRDAR